MTTDVTATWLPSLLAGQPGENTGGKDQQPGQDLSGKYGATGSTEAGGAAGAPDTPPEKESILEEWRHNVINKLPKTVHPALSPLIP